MGAVFGPVPSRRLGRSLGVDVVPFKTCTYDCIYCQLGPTTCKTLERGPWVDPVAVAAEVAEAAQRGCDVVTLSGSGEPTLLAPLGELVARVKAATDVPLAILTNGSLLWREDVRRDVARADVLIPSLDAPDAATFQAVNRPHPAIGFDAMLGGLVAARQAFGGEYRLEVMLLAGVTDTDAALEGLARCVDRIAPDRVQLNTVARPPATDDARAVPLERLRQAAELFSPPTDVIADLPGPATTRRRAARRRDVLALLRRRPCTLEDVAAGLDVHPNEAVKYLDDLAAAGLVETRLMAGARYYRASRAPGGPDRRAP